MTELKPCPFCGSTDIRKVTTFADCTISCGNCKVRISRYLYCGKYDTLREAEEDLGTQAKKLGIGGQTMTDRESRERLVELIVDAVGGCARHWAEIIADHLIANGVIVPPCKVGQKFYWINFVTKEIETDIVVAIHQYENGFKITTNTIGSGTTCTFVLDKFIEIMFLTKEEAEAKLKEMNKDA